MTHLLRCSALLAWLGLVSLGASPAAQAAEARPGIKCAQVQDLVEAYLHAHYLHRRLNEDLKARTVDKFVKALDSTRTLLLESDVAQLKKEVAAAFPQVLEGQCGALDGAYTKVVERAKEARDFVKKFLAQDYKLDEKAEVVMDPEKRGYAKSVQQRDEFLAKMVHFQMAGFKVAKQAPETARKQLGHRYELLVRRLEERRSKDQLADLLDAFALSLDPHSSYLSPDSLDDLRIHMGLSLEGIGASLSSEDGFVVVEEVIPGGAADRDKRLKVKDKIIGVAKDADNKSVSVIDTDLRDVVKMIRGKKGTKVGLTILREGEKTETFDLTLVRDKIDIRDQAAKIRYEERKHAASGKTVKIGILSLPSFYGGQGEGTHSTVVDVKRLLLEAKAKKVDGIILDLSKNGGGLLDEAVKVTGLFIKTGNVVATQSLGGRAELLADEDPDVVYAGPLAVLISRVSASASEIVAGALKDYGRALVLGDTQTFGKGTVQALQSLPPGLGAMKLTIGMFFVPGGSSTQRKGVASDIKFASLMDSPEIGEASLEHVLPPQTIPAFVSKDANSAPEDAGRRWKPVDAPLVSKLAALSKARVEKDPKFAEIAQKLKEAAASAGVVKVSEMLKDSGKDKDGKDGGKDGKEKKDPRKRGKRGSDEIGEFEKPVYDESVSIVSDWVAES
jgi:carboxyl-terminal processing protease